MVFIVMTLCILVFVLYSLFVQHIHFCVEKNGLFLVDIAYLRNKDVECIIRNIETAPIESLQRDCIHLRHSLYWGDNRNRAGSFDGSRQKRNHREYTMANAVQ